MYQNLSRNHSMGQVNRVIGFKMKANRLGCKFVPRIIERQWRPVELLDFSHSHSVKFEGFVRSDF
jgi:hypothetical protein